MLLLLALLLPQAFDDAALRARMRELVAKLGDEDFQTRQAAERDLLSLPARLSPELAAIGKETPDLEVRTRIARVVLPEPWPRLLRGTIGETRARLEGPVHRLVEDLAPRDPRPLLEELLASAEPRAREFALAAYAKYPAKDASRLAPFLTDPALSNLAAAALIAAGDPSVVPKAAEAFAAGGGLVHPALLVLEHFGPGAEAGRIAAAVKSNPELVDPGLRILARGGAEPELVGLLADLPEKGAGIVRALERTGSEACLPAVRAWFKGRPEDAARDRVLFALRDPEWAVERLERERGAEGRTFRLTFDQLAAAGGPALREPALKWLAEPGAKLEPQRELLRLLGAVGRTEDGALLAAKLQDRRLREAAGEALDRLGDPAHARAVLEAFVNSDRGLELRRAAAGLPADDLEETLLEELSDPGKAIRTGREALRLVERRPTARLREALYKGILEFDLGWTSLRAEAARILAASVKPEDAPWIGKLRAHQGRDSTVKVCGLLAAVASGDAKAMPELAGILSGKERFFLPHGEGHGWGASSHLLEWAAPAGAAWKRVVEEAWRGRRDWLDGAIWLASRELREPLDWLRANRETVEAAQRPRVETALAACGDPDALDRLIARGKAQAFLRPEDERAFTAAAGRERRAAVVAEVLGQPALEGGPMQRLAALLAHPDGVSFYRTALARDSGDGILTARCARALAALKVKDAAGELRLLLRSPNVRTRAAAAEALGELGDRSSIPMLVRLLDDPFEVEEEHRSTEYLHRPKRRVWDAAMEALGKIAGVKAEGKTAADRRAFWRTWRERNR